MNQHNIDTSYQNMLPLMLTPTLFNQSKSNPVYVASPFQYKELPLSTLTPYLGMLKNHQYSSNVENKTNTPTVSPHIPPFNFFSEKYPMYNKEKKDQISITEQKVFLKYKQIIILNSLHKALDNLQKECEEEGFKLFSETSKKNAKHILDFVYTKFPNYEYDIYPTEDCEIAINCTPQKGRGVLILCDSNGSVAYFATLDGKNSRFRCDHINDFAYESLWNIFNKLDNKNSYYPVNQISSKGQTSIFNKNEVVKGTTSYISDTRYNTSNTNFEMARSA